MVTRSTGRFIHDMRTKKEKTTNNILKCDVYLSNSNFNISIFVTTTVRMRVCVCVFVHMLSTVDNPTVTRYINSNMSRRIVQNTIAYPTPKKTVIPVHPDKYKSKAEFGPWYERHMMNGCIILGAIYLSTAFVGSSAVATKNLTIL